MKRKLFYLLIAGLMTVMAIQETGIAQSRFSRPNRTGRLSGLSSLDNIRQDKRLWGNYSSEKIDLKFSGKSGMTIILEHSFGAIDVRKGSNNQVIIKGEKRVFANDDDFEKKFLKEMKLKTYESGSKLTISSYYPDSKGDLNRSDRNNLSFSITYSIEIPDNVNLEIENSFGDLDLMGLKGTFEINNKFGILSVDNLKGKTILNNQFGTLSVENIEGNSEIKNEHGELRIDSITGDLEAGNKFGETHIFGVTGDVRIHTAHGATEVEKVSGDLDFTGTFGSIYCAEISGIVDIQNNNAKVEVEGVKSDVDIDNSFGPVIIMNVDGNITVTNRHGSITVEDILKSDSDSKTVRLETSFSSIDLLLSANVSARIEASTTFGRIRSDFETENERSSFNSESLSIRAGGEKHRIDLETNNGSIRIRKR